MARTISEKVKDIIVDKLGIDEKEITNEKTFSDLSADSLDTVELIMEFEKEFQVSLPDKEMEDIKTVGEAIGIITKYAEAKS